MSDDFSAHFFEIFAFIGVESDAKQFFELWSELVGKEQFGDRVASPALGGNDAY
jgi:hypothetical protein